MQHNIIPWGTTEDRDLTLVGKVICITELVSQELCPSQASNVLTVFDILPKSFEKQQQGSGTPCQHCVMWCPLVTSRNIKLVTSESGCSPWDYSSIQVKAGLKKTSVPENNEWRLSLLMKMLECRRTEEKQLTNTDRLTEIINSLCDT